MCKIQFIYAYITFSYNFIEILFYMRYKDNMNLNQLKYISVTAEELNISKAAEKLYISQPSLSKSIKHLPMPEKFS